MKTPASEQGLMMDEEKQLRKQSRSELKVKDILSSSVRCRHTGDWINSCKIHTILLPNGGFSFVYINKLLPNSI